MKILKNQRNCDILKTECLHVKQCPYDGVRGWACLSSNSPYDGVRGWACLSSSTHHAFTLFQPLSYTRTCQAVPTMHSLSSSLSAIPELVKQYPPCIHSLPASQRYQNWSHSATSLNLPATHKSTSILSMSIRKKNNYIYPQHSKRKHRRNRRAYIEPSCKQIFHVH